MGENFPNLKQFNFWQLFNPLEMTLSIIQAKKRRVKPNWKLKNQLLQPADFPINQENLSLSKKFLSRSHARGQEMQGQANGAPGGQEVDWSVDG